MMMLMLVLIRVFILMTKKDAHFNKWMGIPMVSLYFVFIALQYLLSSTTG